uniref:Rhodanese domain-containing protein n=1 Tax=Pyrodinium bahamense TaxID=73915 RepID=A0A7S0FVE6_9DINO
MVAGWDVSLESSMRGMVPQNARSVAHKPLPPVPADLRAEDPERPPVTLMLFYQYVEPAWTPKQHRRALAFTMELGRKLGVTGRGRCAAEGLNCTLTGTAEGIRAFAQGLRDWDPIFDETDFKLTDGLDYSKRFKSLTIQKKEELVAYGLPVDLAPSLKANATKHVEADEYHKMMAQPNTVIIDVRNHYEAAIGHFQPPPGGAEFIDPKVRNSHELPKWLATPEVKDKLQGKKVMMYCTGGIRCERFSALLSQIKEEQPDFHTEGEFMVRGGIERYMKTFPEGGYWKGKNFLFDKRQEQIPEKKPAEELKREVESHCAKCKALCGEYRGGFKCNEDDCQVPIIVCSACREALAAAAAPPPKLRCPLCEEGFCLRDKEAPKLKRAEKRKGGAAAHTEGRQVKRMKKFAGKGPCSRLFIGNLPFVVDASAVKEALSGGVELIKWIADRSSGLWYGSAFVEMRSVAEAERVVRLAGEGAGIRAGKRRLRVNFAPPAEGEAWPPPEHAHLERPPVPVDPGR